MPPRRKKKTSQAHLVYGDTPEIEALATGFARQGFFNSGYEKARRFANATTSSYLAARKKPDGSYTPARFAYTTGVMEPDLGGQFAMGTSASGLASDLDYKDARALQTAFDKSSKNPVRNVHGQSLSMPGTQLAVLKGVPVFKFKDVAVSPAAEAFAAIHTQSTARRNLSDAQRALREWRLEARINAP